MFASVLTNATSPHFSANHPSASALKVGDPGIDEELIVRYLDRAGHPVAIEILDASSHFSNRSLSRLPLPEAMVPLSEASRRAGLDPATLRQQIRRKRLRATKHHREWWVEPAALQEYLDNRAPQGRRSARKASAK